MRRYVEVRRAEVTAKKRQDEIMKYLSKNQDVIKEELVNALTGKFGSRHTIYDAINEHEELKKVIVTRVNRQLHRVSMNPSSELNKINDLDQSLISTRFMNIAHNLQKDFKRSLDFAMHFISKTNYMIMNKSNMFRMNVRGIEYNP